MNAVFSQSKPLRYSTLRYYAFVGQLVVLGIAVLGFRLTLPWEWILLALSLVPATNIFEQRTGILMLIDIAVLTTVLCLSGGPTNPFTIFYLLQVVLAAVLLTSTWTWIIAAATALGFGMLFLAALPVPEWAVHGSHGGLSLHLHGMLLAYLIVALLAAFFLSAIIRELRNKERQIERLNQIANNQERLATLATITAGAAHELGTPLGTISIVAGELERTVNASSSLSPLAEDIALLKAETARCKKVLAELSERSGALQGEEPVSISAADLVSLATDELTLRSVLQTHDPHTLVFDHIPVERVASAIRALIKNADEANDSTETILISIASHGNSAVIEIKDRGAGIPEDWLRRIGEPFFSTKKPGRGMGLGVYLSRLTFEQIGGSLSYDSVHPHGTVARIEIPIDCVFGRKAA